jgi:hypothetical protein
MGAIAHLHNRVRLAEQLAVADCFGPGRLNVVIDAGYRSSFERRDRGRLVEESLEVFRLAWTGEPFEWQNRTIVVTPISTKHSVARSGHKGGYIDDRLRKSGTPVAAVMNEPERAWKHLATASCTKRRPTHRFKTTAPVPTGRDPCSRLRTDVNNFRLTSCARVGPIWC